MIVDIQQNTPSWLAWRRDKIGGSDANLIAAWFLDAYDYPFGSWAGAELYKLWAIKTGRMEPKPDKDNSWGDYVDPKKHGHETEDEARAWYSRETGEFAPAACVQHDINGYLAASLDGYIAGELILEIKCPKEPDDHRKAKEGQIPDKYFAQFQHNLFVANVPLLHYVSYYKPDKKAPGEGVIVPVKPDAEFLDELREAEEEFHRWMLEGVFPLASGGEQKGRDDELWKLAASDWLKISDKERAIEKEKRAIQRRIARLMSGNYKTEGSGIAAALSIRGPSVVPSFEKQGGLELRVTRK